MIAKSCVECGALVEDLDMPKHVQWHARIDRDTYLREITLKELVIVK